ncbi:MAG: methyltransferase domain-containing protein [Pseudomonadota bacterium]
MAEEDLPTHWFERADTSPDEHFYAQPRLVTHIDDATIEQLTAYYRTFIPAGAAVLDLMSSWISHLPDDLALDRVAGLGMNAEELAQNDRLSDWCVHNLNTEPALPYPDAAFDRIVLAVSVQYLIQPIAVMKSASQVLKPGGKICIAMSHRLFPTKAIAAFQRLGPEDRIRLVMAYLAEAGFVDVEFVDRSPSNADPLWLVVGLNP